jgi:hypothetical protein
MLRHPLVLMTEQCAVYHRRQLSVFDPGQSPLRRLPLAQSTGCSLEHRLNIDGATRENRNGAVTDAVLLCASPCMDRPNLNSLRAHPLLTRLAWKASSRSDLYLIPERNEAL